MNWGRLVRACTVAEERTLNVEIDLKTNFGATTNDVTAARQSVGIFVGLVYFECPSGVSRIIRTIMAVLYLPLCGPFGLDFFNEI